MPVNLFAAVGTDAANALDNILQNALPVLLPAIMLLVVAITVVLLFLYLFGFKLGLGEKFKERLRRKKEARRGKFPLAIRRRATKETGRKVDAKSPWSDPAAWVDTTANELFDTTAVDSDIAFFTDVNEMMANSSMHIFLDPDRGSFRAAQISELAAIYKRKFKEHSDNVVSNWSMTFGHLGSLAGLADSNLDFETKRVLFMHAAKVTRMKMDALAENQSEWAKQYGDGMASRPVQFVA